jgi:myosin heavy subunit
MGNNSTWRMFLTWLTPRSFQTKTVETTLAGLKDDPWSSKLPPLMNPAMLEASDDLTSLSHLNEPAGMHI